MWDAQATGSYRKIWNSVILVPYSKVTQMGNASLRLHLTANFYLEKPANEINLINKFHRACAVGHLTISGKWN